MNRLMGFIGGSLTTGNIFYELSITVLTSVLALLDDESKSRALVSKGSSNAQLSAKRNLNYDISASMCHNNFDQKKVTEFCSGF